MEERDRRTKNQMRKPKILGVSVVAENILLLRVQQGEVIGGVQEPYEPRLGETLETDPDFPATVYIVKDGEYVGIKVEDRQLGTRRFPLEQLSGEALDVLRADEPKNWRVNGLAPLRVYRKTKPNNIADPRKMSDSYKEYAFLHSIYLVCSQTFEEGKKIRTKISEGLLEQSEIEVVVEAEKLMSEAIHVNQLGYRKDDPSKKAYLSQWMGLGGGISYDGYRWFYLMNENGKKVYRGKISLNHTGGRNPVGKEELFSCCPVYEMDFSDFSGEGMFRILIPGLGCSFPFVIDSKKSWRKGFRASMNALYCQRSGIRTGKPYTVFERPRVYHPDDGRVVYQSTCSLFASGNGLNCYGTDVNNFGNLLRGATEEVVENAWGGYFDACDWDRRIQHLRASRLQIELFLMFPEYFAEEELPIPESGNGIPDILNEACWNIDFYKRLQLADGGIRGGIEAEEHPLAGQCGWQDSWKAYAYAPDFWSSYYYASAAAAMAYALRDISRECSDGYAESAIKAFSYAEETYETAMKEEGHKWTRRAHAGVVTELENASAALFRLTGEEIYENRYLSVRSDKNYDADFVYATLPNGIGKETFKRTCRDALVYAAEQALVHAKTFPYHLTSEDPASERGMGWGGFATVPRNIQLIRAHYLTKDAKYLRGALAAADFSLGANPDNLCFTTGLGSRFPQHILHHDSRITGQEAPVGISVFGLQDFHHPDDNFPRLLQMDFLWPGAYVWPTEESYLDIYRHPCENEYTVQGTLGPMGYQWGYFAAREELSSEDDEQEMEEE